ncbi:acyl-CoA thioester hydrolase [Plasticicumulans lactativorans]|uniref:Acyl-CoA thioester hydrolase n=1 Tax=Plasticicumulans lactativorans TaxID=1133106 RepID=A0A4R2L6E5_9GAMM|nr:thioesterase family protein [Plasticicumulans lactativorans]TCO82059.1 acyl-CoA thioester hydrolase [Plasticicumulans lactativorans]
MPTAPECSSPPCLAHEIDPAYQGLAPALAPLAGTVAPEWIDYNGHMNVACYVMAFDRATDALLDAVGMDAAYRAASACSVFVLEMHVNYLQELTVGAAYTIASRVLGADAKRLHLFHTLTRCADGVAAATNELMLLHVDLGARRGRPFPAAIADRLAALQAADARQPCPEQAGRRITLPVRAGG